MRACDVACGLFAAWTIVCHLVVLLGGSLTQLLWTAGALALALAATLVVRGRPVAVLVTEGSAATVAEQRAEETDDAYETAREAPWAWAASGLAVLVAFAATRSLTLLWWLLVAYLGSALLLAAREPGSALPATRGRGLERALWALALVGILVTLVAHRVGYDDTFYANVAVGAADHPDRPLLREDTLHGIAGLPLYLPVYRFQSLELLVAALSSVTALEPLVISHLVVAPLAGALVVLAWARLFRLLLPRWWLWGVATLVVLMLGVGETPHWYANLAFVRLQHGKAIFLSAALPLVISYAIELARAPSSRHWVRLTAAQIASVGLTVSAMWAAPTIATLGLLSALPASRRNLTRLLAGIGSSAYVLSIAFAARAETARALPMLERGRAIPTIAGSITDVLGDGRIALAALVSVLFAWQLVRGEASRRVCIVFPLAFLGVFLNPYWCGWIAENVTGSVTYWRVFWILPVPLLLTVCLTAPLSVGDWRRWRTARAIAAILLVIGFAAFAPRVHTLTAENRTRLGWPGLKVPPEFRVAEALVRQVPPRSFVIAPLGVSAWVPTLRGHPYPAVSRASYLRSHARRIDRAAMRRRLRATQFVGGRAFAPGERALREALRIDAPTGVCLHEGASAVRARAILHDAGFHRTYSDGDFEIWITDVSSGSRARGPGGGEGRPAPGQ